MLKSVANIRRELEGHGMMAAEREAVAAGKAIRLVATDLDGTLLGDDHRSVSERTRRALLAAQEAGITLVLVTGRPPRFVHPLAEELGLTGAAVCCNGAIVYDVVQGELLEHTPIASATAITLVERLRAAAPGVGFAVERGLRYGSEPAYRALRGEFQRPDDDEIADALSLCAQPVTKLIARHPELDGPGYYPYARETVSDLAMVTISGPRFIEIAALGVDKAAALERFCARLGITSAEVMAFGDMPNDAPMLRWAGRGIAVANAHTEALAAADETTASNMEDGVALALERLLDGL
ncbi:MAG TPA: HAD family hydrolase [Ktedonobacterales bacterium]|nr:HAD family hydrolase [Ktedonobacterales bacterium]